MSRFAYTTYAKTLIKLRTWARGGEEGDPAAFLIKIQTSARLRGPVRLPPSTLYKSDRPVSRAHHSSMPAARRRRRTTRRTKRGRSQQLGGILPFIPLLVLALAAAGKAAALGALGGAAGYAAKRGLAAATRRRG